MRNAESLTSISTFLMLMCFIISIQRNEFVTNFLEGRTPYDELALIFEVPTSYIGREVSWILDIAFLAHHLHHFI